MASYNQLFTDKYYYMDRLRIEQCYMGNIRAISIDKKKLRNKNCIFDSGPGVVKSRSTSKTGPPLMLWSDSLQRSTGELTHIILTRHKNHQLAWISSTNLFVNILQDAAVGPSACTSGDLVCTLIFWLVLYLLFLL